MLTLKNFDEQDAQASGLLGKMHNAKFIGVVTIMNHILPFLNRLSCTFQQGKVSFAHIQPTLEKCIDDLNKTSQTVNPITEFQSDLSPNCRLRQAELILSDRNKQFLRNFLAKYVSSLKESIKNRFPTLLSAFSIFNPAHVPERDDGLAAKPRRKCPPKIFNTAPPPLAGLGSVSESVPVVILHNVGVQATDDYAQLYHSVEEEVEETSKALDLPDLDAEDSDYGSDFEFL